MITAAHESGGEKIDVGVQHIAKVYAKALLGAAESAGQTSELIAEFDALQTEVLSQHPELEAVLASALIAHEEKTALLERVFGGRLSPLLLNFLKVVSSHGRLDTLRAIHQELRKLYDALKSRVRVHLTTAAPLDSQLTKSLTQSLRGMLGEEPEIETSVDPELIGGIVLRIGDTVYDGSVARQLEQVREQMINRSVHEIQGRRDRFRHSGGD